MPDASLPVDSESYLEAEGASGSLNGAAGVARGGARGGRARSRRKRRGTRGVPFGPLSKPTPTTYGLTWQECPFAGGSLSNVTYGNLIPRAEDVDECMEVMAFGEEDGEGPCSHPSHLRVVCRFACTAGSDDWCRESRSGEKECRAALRKEAAAYKHLWRLQGRTLPVFHGVWKPQGCPDLYVYEDLGLSVSVGC